MEATSGMKIDGEDNDCGGERATEARPDGRGLTTHRLPAALFDDLYTSTEKRDLFIGTIESLPPFLLVVGGLDDAMLTVSAAADSSVRRHVLLCTPEEDECMDFLRRIDDVESVSLVPYPESIQNRQVLVSVAKSLPSCRGMGFTAFDAEYAALFTEPERQRFAPTMKLLPITAVSPDRERATKRIVVHAHNICVSVHRSERPIINPRWWERIMSVCTSFETEVVITGDPELASAYPAPEGTRDMRGASLSEQRRMACSADIFISSDCPELVIAAMSGAFSVRCTPMRGFDLVGHKPYRETHVYPLINDISTVRDAEELIRVCTDHAGKLLTRGSKVKGNTESTPAVKNEKSGEQEMEEVRGNQLSSFHPVFWKRSYESATSVLVKSSGAVGDSLMITGVVHELRVRYPHVKICVSGPGHVLDVFRHHPDVTALVLRGSSEELTVERDADEVIEYNYIVDRFPEYYHGIHLVDILANIAGVHMPSRDIVYTATEEELRYTYDVLTSRWGSLSDILFLGVNFTTNKDTERSYPHGALLVESIVRNHPNVRVVNVGTAPIGIVDDRVLDCSALKEWGLREHIAVMSHCHKALTIDSSFLHVAHNLWRIPTFMLETVSRRELIVNDERKTVRPYRNTEHGCTACYWLKPACKRGCMNTLSVDKLFPEVSKFLEDASVDFSMPDTAFHERYLAVDDASQSIARVFNENVHRRELITPVIRVTPDMPAYVRAWNGVRVEDATENHQGVTDVQTAESIERVAQPVAPTTTSTAGSLSGAVVWS